MTTDEELTAIKRALSILIDGCLAHRQAGSPGSEGPRTISFADITMGETKAQEAAEAIAHDPIGESLRVSVRMLGKRLHEIGGMAAMHEAIEEAALAKGENQYSARVDIMDKRWDGIGASETSSGWMA